MHHFQCLPLFIVKRASQDFAGLHLLNLRNLSHYANYLNRRVPNLPNLQLELLQSQPENVSNSRLLQVAVIGTPNAGKSTLINQLVGWNICTVSKKVHTTRKMAKAMFVEGETQVVFLDTPGCVDKKETKRHKLESSFITDPERALLQSDLFVVLHDVSNKWTLNYLSPKVLRLLYLYPEKQSILVLNKVDKLKEKRKLLDISRILTCNVVGGEPSKSTSSYSRIIQSQSRKITLDKLEGKGKDQNSYIKECNTPENQKLEAALQRRLWTEKELESALQNQVGWPHFSRMFMTSALESDGTGEIREYLVESARPSRWLYSSAVVTDQSPYDMAIAALKGKLLETFPNELPYEAVVSIQYWDINPAGALNVVFQIACPTARSVPLFIGNRGCTIAALCQQTETELRNLFRCDLKIRINVTSPNDRRKS